ncbi:unnamed protein product [Linum trigynum]|uniref:Uncharacterized protein n=1 Tax=Linum trigynum TaxID=586398 RepID=A0AAV2GD01_9ROSI
MLGLTSPCMLPLPCLSPLLPLLKMGERRTWRAGLWEKVNSAVEGAQCGINDGVLDLALSDELLAESGPAACSPLQREMER